MAPSKKTVGKAAMNSRGKKEQGGASLGHPAQNREKPEAPHRNQNKKTKHTMKRPKKLPVATNSVTRHLLLPPWMLQCQRGKAAETRLLVWETHEQAQTRRTSEEAVLRLLYKGEEEFGLSRQFSNSRKEEIRKACRRAGIPLLQALSLRRSYMKKANPRRTMPDMGLGSYKNIQAAASLFEDALINFLRRKRIPFYSEQAQRDHFRAHSKGRGGSPPTPDILLRKEIRVHKQHDTSGKEYCVCWIDAKMFYGASLIEPDDYSAVGRLLQTARKYVSCYGPGAFVFYYGCGYELAQDLLVEGVLALDCSKGFSLEVIREHQRTWCADRGGYIWP